MFVPQIKICPGLLTLCVLALVFSHIVAPKNCAAQSLWEKRDVSRALIFEDLKARRVGDLLTIVISESTGFNHQDSRDLSKSTSTASSGDFNYGVGGDIGIDAGNANGAHNTSSDRQFAGDTSASTSRVFNDRFTVQVIDVLPNGNMLVSGEREIDVEGDTRRLVVTGVIRGHDIFADNTVSSRLVGNLQVKYDGKGVETHFKKQGWLGKQVNRIWPH